VAIRGTQEMSKTEEALGILQEECAEVIVEVSKIRRFGLNSVSWKTNVPHNETLEMEVGDVLAMVDILLEQGVIKQSAIDAAKTAKKEKLKKFSNLFTVEE
jgi:NTP pyrophosphatase (non-canonical NTP hydrolase)